MMATTQTTMVVNSKVVKWMEEMSPRLSDFSIEYILSHKGPGGHHGSPEYANHNDEDSMSDGNSTNQQQFDWLQCTRYRPPKLQRSRRKEGRQRRKPGRNPRIPFSGTQVAVLEERFRVGHYLSSTEVERLSNLLCLSETRVKIWFQNRRARERRERETTSGKNKLLEVNCVEEKPPRTGASNIGSSPVHITSSPVNLNDASSPSTLKSNVELSNTGTQISYISSIRSAFIPCQPFLTKTLYNFSSFHRNLEQ